MCGLHPTLLSSFLQTLFTLLACSTDGARHAAILRIPLVRLLVWAPVLQMVKWWQIRAVRAREEASWAVARREAGAAEQRSKSMAILAGFGNAAMLVRAAIGLSQSRLGCLEAVREWETGVRIDQGKKEAAGEWQRRGSKMRQEKSAAEAKADKLEREMRTSRQRIAELESQVALLKGANRYS